MKNWRFWTLRLLRPNHNRIVRFGQAVAAANVEQRGVGLRFTNQV